ncbi:hypothetical protein DM02DRAFT_656366 [Periconia macrospinosa]|uniref:Uncharacterized protein n=1 Tax=Periconia macrospinosa TaxID=97972 RepID=A0A2V1DQ35_9PLEO|nr:hypothetical protein DM02DRAFT_656366 [Periconia macrospinosa]
MNRLFSTTGKRGFRTIFSLPRATTVTNHSLRPTAFPLPRTHIITNHAQQLRGYMSPELRTQFSVHDRSAVKQIIEDTQEILKIVKAGGRRNRGILGHTLLFRTSLDNESVAINRIQNTTGEILEILKTREDRRNNLRDKFKTCSIIAHAVVRCICWFVCYKILFAILCAVIKLKIMEEKEKENSIENIMENTAEKSMEKSVENRKEDSM